MQCVTTLLAISSKPQNTQNAHKRKNDQWVCATNQLEVSAAYLNTCAPDIVALEMNNNNNKWRIVPAVVAGIKTQKKQEIRRRRRRRRHRRRRPRDATMRRRRQRRRLLDNGQVYGETARIGQWSGVR